MPIDYRKRAMTASLLIAGLMLIGKVFAAYLTGSVAILSDALESIIHIGATSVAAFSLWYSRLPADRDHPYGHGKIAYFSAGLEGAFILVASLSIFTSSIRAWIFGQELGNLSTGLTIIVILALVNLLLGLYLIRIGHRENSLVLLANGQHAISDMITSSGVVLGIFLVWATGLTWLDPLVGILIGINVLVMAWSLMRRAYDGLMERADPQQTERIRDILRKAVKDNVLVDWHQLRHRIVDTDLWIEVHLLMASDQTLRAAHHAVTKLEDEIRVLFPGRTVRITTHLEPADHELDHPPGHPDHRQEDEIF